MVPVENNRHLSFNALVLSTAYWFTAYDALVNPAEPVESVIFVWLLLLLTIVVIIVFRDIVSGSEDDSLLPSSDALVVYFFFIYGFISVSVKLSTLLMDPVIYVLLLVNVIVVAIIAAQNNPDCYFEIEDFEIQNQNGLSEINL